MMKASLKSARVALAMILVQLLTVTIAYGQPQKALQISAISRSQNVDGTLVVTVVGDQPLLPFLSNSKLLYRLVGGSVGAPVGFQTQTGSGDADKPNTLIFALAASSLQNADEVEYYVQISDASTTLSESIHYQLNLLAQRQISALSEANKKLTGETESQTTQIKQLLAQTISPPPNLAEIISISDAVARFRLTTAKYAKVRVELIRDDNNSLIDTWTSPDLLRDHAVILKGLVGGLKYRVQAWVLNHLKGDTYDKDNPQLTSISNSALKFPAPDKVDPPVLQVLAITKTSNSISVPVNLSDGFISINLEVLADPIHNKYKKIDSRGSLRVDDFGRVSGDRVEQSYTFSPLTPNTQYKITFQAMNSAGKTLVSPESLDQIVSTLPELPFEFAGGINLDISPLTGFTATWEATAAPEGGSFDVVFGDDSPITSQPAKVTGNKLTASLPVNELKSLYEKVKGKTKPIQPPTLTFRMKSKSGSVSRQTTMTVAFSMPTEDKLKEAKANNIVSDDEVKQIQKVIKGATDGSSGFKWKDLLSTGVGILLRFLVP